MLILDKRTDETEYQHHKRIVFGKLVDGSLSDYNYTTLSKYLYGKEYSEDVARRMFYGSCRTLKMVDEATLKDISEEDVLNEIELKMHELRKEKQKYSDQRRELTKLLSSEGRFEHICEKLTESADKLNKSYPLISGEYVAPINASDKEAIVVFSDWHYGLVTENISNTYNTTVCKNRVNYVVDRAIERIQLHGCQKLHVVVTGDLIHGAIHTSARVASEELTCDQLMHASELLAQAIEKLSRYTQFTDVHVTYGNHARVIPNKNDSIHRDNFERLIPWWLSQRLKANNNISVYEDTGDEFVTVTACGYGIVATHGDLDNMTTMTNILSPMFKEYFDKCHGVQLRGIIMGDKHCFESKSGFGVRPFICGSLCGSDDYANSKRLYSDPSQLLIIMNPDVGIDAVYTINC